MKEKRTAKQSRNRKGQRNMEQGEEGERRKGGEDTETQKRKGGKTSRVR